MENYTDIVAVQYDLHWRNDMTTSQAAFKPSERMSSHSYSVTPLDGDSYRVIIYSMSNATMAGHDGEVHQLLFTMQGDVDYTGSVITIDNIILSNAIGVNKSSQSKVEYVAQKQDIGTNIPLLPINLNSSVKKIILDNQVLIIRDNKTYNVMGQEL
jgi:hypothetical protein